MLRHTPQQAASYFKDTNLKQHFPTAGFMSVVTIIWRDCSKSKFHWLSW